MSRPPGKRDVDDSAGEEHTRPDVGNLRRGRGRMGRSRRWRRTRLVAYDVGPAHRAARPAFAEPVRNATVVIDEGGARKGYSTPGHGVRRRHGDGGQPRLDGPHRHVGARGADGTAALRRTVLPGTTATVPGVDGLAAGDYAFYCRFHPNMRGILVVDRRRRRRRAASEPSFDQPLVVPPTAAGADIRLVMRARRRAHPAAAGRVRRCGPTAAPARAHDPAARRARTRGSPSSTDLPRGRRGDVGAPPRRPPRAEDDGQPTTLPDPPRRRAAPTTTR